MKLVDCRKCGSKEFFEEGNQRVCAFCQSKYITQVDDLTIKDTRIGVATDIENLLEKCKIDPSNRRRYASLVLDLDPFNEEAIHYLQ